MTTDEVDNEGTDRARALWKQIRDIINENEAMKLSCSALSSALEKERARANKAESVVKEPEDSPDVVAGGEATQRIENEKRNLIEGVELTLEARGREHTVKACMHNASVSIFDAASSPTNRAKNLRYAAMYATAGANIHEHGVLHPEKEEK